jgi:hypothetical protein
MATRSPAELTVIETFLAEIVDAATDYRQELER